MFRGSIPPLITPFRQGRIDEEALRRLVERLPGGAPHANAVGAPLDDPLHKPPQGLLVNPAPPKRGDEGWYGPAEHGAPFALQDEKAPGGGQWFLCTKLPRSLVKRTKRGVLP